MILLAGGGEEGRTINSRSTRWLSIVQPPMITVTVCLVGGWTINGSLEWRRMAILLAWEEERTNQQRPCRGTVQEMEPHLIAWFTRPTRA